MSSPIIQVDCASCGTTYRLALPKVLIDKPHKSMSFRCNHCSYKFQIQPKEILEQQAVADTLILVSLTGDGKGPTNLQVHHNLESVADLIEKGTYGSEDLIRVFGQEWSMMGDEPTLSEMFTPAANPQEAVNVPNEQVQGDSSPENVSTDSVSDVSLEFEEDLAENPASSSPASSISETESLHLADSEQEMSEIDPFSESQADFDVDQSYEDDIVDESLDADFFADLGVDEPIEEEHGTQDVFNSDISAVDAGADFDEWAIETISEDNEFDDLTVEATADVDHAIVDALPVEQTQVSMPDSDDDWFGDLDVDEAVDGSLDDPQSQGEAEFSSQAIAANLWDELDLDEESEDVFVEPETQTEARPSSLSSPQSAAQITDAERNIQSMKSSLLGGPEPKNFHSETLEEADASMVPEMEIDEDDGEISEAVEATKPKQRLSFSNKVPEVKQVKKKEINQYYAFAGIILFSVGVLGYVLWNSEPEVQEFNGIETNSNMLSEMTEPKDGLQENNNTTGEAKSSVEQADGSNDASSEMLTTNESGKEGNEYGDGFVDPYPQVLPDVPEESFDFANDKSSRELTREGYQALKQGKPDKAVKLFELALKKDPKFAEAVLGLGRAHQKRGELNLAKDAYCRHSDLPESSFAAKTMVEEVNISQGIVSQLGLNCDEAL